MSVFFNLIIIGITVVLTVTSIDAFAKKAKIVRFNETIISVPFDLTHPIMIADILERKGKEIVTFSIDDENRRWLIIYSLSNEQLLKEVSRLVIPNNLYSFDITQYRSGNIQTLYFLSSEGVSQFDENKDVIESSQIITSYKISTLAVGEQTQHLSKGHFLKDLNNDNIDDIFLPDFNQTHFLIKDKSTFQHTTLPIKPRAVFNGSSAKYYVTPLYFQDLNFDGLLDIIYVEKGKLIYFSQTDKAIFNNKPQTIVIDNKIHGIEWWDQKDTNGEQLNQSSLSYKKIEQLKDMNNDGIPDMIVRFTQSEGVLDKTNDYEIYLGTNKNNALHFEHDVTNIIKGDGTLTDMQLIDINDDNTFEILVSGFKLGVSQIIGALLSGSIDQDVHLFYMNEKGLFNKKSKISKEVELTFSLSSGTSGSPIVKLADLNGDKRKDLILSKGDDKLLIYFGINNDSLFLKKSEKFNTLLPTQSDMVISDDINGDGKVDLLIKFGREDDQTLSKTFKILMSH